MANVFGRLALNGINVIQVDTDPSTGLGTADVIGTLALVNDGSGVFYHYAAGDTDWSLLQSSADTTFLDSTFRIEDDVDPTKEIAFEASSITTATTRTISVPDRDLTLDTITAGSTDTNLTAGSVLFSDGTKIQQDNTNYFWDDTANRLQIGGTPGVFGGQLALTDTALAGGFAITTVVGGQAFFEVITQEGVDAIFDANQGLNAYIGTASDHEFYIQTNNSTRITFGNSTTNGNIGIGSTAPNAEFNINLSQSKSTLNQVRGASVFLTNDSSGQVRAGQFVADFSGAGSTDALYGIFALANMDTAGTASAMYGISGAINASDGSLMDAQSVLGLLTLSGTSATTVARSLRGVIQNTSDGIMTDLVGLDILAEINNTSGTTSNLYGVRIGGWFSGGTPTITNSYGLYIDSTINIGATQYAIYSAANIDSYLAGDLGIGTSTPEAKTHIMGTDASVTADAATLLFLENNVTDVYLEAAVVTNGNFGIVTSDSAGSFQFYLGFEIGNQRIAMAFGAININFGATLFEFNGNGADVDYQFRTDNSDYTLFLDGGTDRVGVNTPAPDAIFHVMKSDTTAVADTNAIAFFEDNSPGQTIYIQLAAPSNGNGGLIIGDSVNPYYFDIETDWANSRVTEYVGLALVNHWGETLIDINAQNFDIDFQVRGLTVSPLFYTDAANDRVAVGTATPTSKFQVAGSISFPYRSVTGGTTLTNTDHTIDEQTGGSTETLPTAVSITGRIYVIHNSGNTNITLDANGPETINGSLTITIPAGEARSVQSTGSNWITI